MSDEIGDKHFTIAKRRRCVMVASIPSPPDTFASNGVCPSARLYGMRRLSLAIPCESHIPTTAQSYAAGCETELPSRPHSISVDDLHPLTTLEPRASTSYPIYAVYTEDMCTYLPYTRRHGFRLRRIPVLPMLIHLSSKILGRCTMLPWLSTVVRAAISAFWS